MEKTVLDKINKFTRRPLTEEEVYVFPAVLCDNDIDRDGERFSDEALETLRELFVGRTGIFDHKAAAANQAARIFDTELAEDPSRKTKDGRPYKFLRAKAYMVRTEENRDLIAEIDGGIKKEVSISCAAAVRRCSVCGNDRNSGGCAHVNGKTYAGRLCHTILDKITDAYEWSFVAVPAQVRAGVTKKFSDGEAHPAPVQTEDIAQELRRDIRRLAYFSGGRAACAAAELAARELGCQELIKLKKSYEALAEKACGGLQLAPEEEEKPVTDQFRLR
ncbi:MAG TPA: hypothetical protein DCZ62_04855 [Ruminococcus sp.]|nr:hypothetical protein [Ruminococcus sp.]